MPGLEKVINLEVTRKYETRYETGEGILSKVDFTQFKPDKVAIITDRNVMAHGHVRTLEKILQRQDIPYIVIPIDFGRKSENMERYKTFATYQRITAVLDKAGFTKGSLIIGMGGGVDGDMAATVAAWHLRGMPLMQVPTNLSAMDDSSIGGKGALNSAYGKNRDGPIYPPRLVVADVQFLSTVPETGILCGLAEALKMAVVLDKKFFEYLEENPKRRDTEHYLMIVNECVRLKTDIVAEDPFEEVSEQGETGKRVLLNYGHTVGHALEALTKKPHGLCVSMGMPREAAVAVKTGHLRQHYMDRIVAAQEAIGLPTGFGIDMQQLIPYMRRDKKNMGEGIRFVILTGIGSVLEANGRYAHPVPESVILAA